jgi:NADH dehydrogenase/NADH:ubiquinone oxidoreductase subunit G
MTSLFNLNITINNILLKINLTKIRTILHLSLLLNKSKKTTVFIEIPRFCFHPRLPIAGNCRMCLIELFKAPKLVVACTTRVQEGMVLFTNSNLVKKARENLLEFFLANHPLDCPICDQGGECDLQNQLEVFGLDHTRYNENIKKVSKVINIGVISFQMTRCIHCTRCVRFLTNVADNFSLGVIARGNKMKISKYINMYLYNEFLSNIVDLCPVGYIINRVNKKLKACCLHNTKYPFIYYYCGALTTTNTAYRIRS